MRKSRGQELPASIELTDLLSLYVNLRLNTLPGEQLDFLTPSRVYFEAMALVA